ncbi:MAG: hypothetical protein Q4E56_03735 [Pseudomonadota bacterium]|nr:hypothetical protein [Pseudomonadota bacterium]
MKYIRILVLSLFVLPFAARGASSEFMVAAQLLSAAKNADIQQVQALVNNGALPLQMAIRSPQHK